MKYKLVISISFLLSFIGSSTLAAKYNGVLSYPQALKLTSPTTGVVNNSVAAGGFFTKGDKLLAFDISILQSQIAVSKTEIHLQQKISAEAKREFKRSEELYEGTMLSDHELKLAEIAFLTQKKRLQTLKSNLATLRWDLKFSSIKAPFDGYLVLSHAYAGQYINNQLKAIPVLGFVSSANLLIKIHLSNSQLSSESKLMKLMEGDEITIQPVFLTGSASDTVYKGKFMSIVNPVSQQGGTISADHKILIIKLLVQEHAKKQQIPLDGSLINVLIE